MKIKNLIGFNLFILGFILVGATGRCQKPVYNIVSFGAVSGVTFNVQKAIQNAIDSCANNGGGTVLIPSGSFYSSTIYLKDDIELNFSNGATLNAIADMALYKNDKKGLLDAGESFIPALVVANKCKNISITGSGKIVGQPSFYYTTIKDNDSYPGYNKNALESGVNMQRPWVNDPKISLVYISDCENVTLKDISIINSPNWSCHLQWSQKVRVDGIKIISSLNEGVNSDGLDIDGCKDVIVSNSIIKTGDDAICLKTTKQGKRTETCEDIMVDNCILSSSSCAIKIGTESNSDFKRISITNCQISNTNRGIGIIVRDGATVSDVKFSDISLECKRKPFFWWGNGEAFHFIVLKRNVNSKIGIIKNVTLKNINGTEEGTSSILGFDYGNEEQKSIRNIILRDIDLKLNKESELDKRAVYGIEIANAANIKINDLSFNWDSLNKQDTWKNALYINNVDQLNMQDISLQKEADNNPDAAIFLHNVSNAYLEPKAQQAYKIDADGIKTENIVVSQLEKKPLIILNHETKRKIRTIN